MNREEASKNLWSENNFEMKTSRTFFKQCFRDSNAKTIITWRSPFRTKYRMKGIINSSYAKN